MLWFIIGIVLIVIGVAVALFAPSKSRVTGSGFENPEYINVKKFAVVPIFLALLFILLSTVTVVGTRSVGVPTVFGKPTGETYSAGLSFKAPWVSVTDIDATIQPEEYRGEDCIGVKIADGGTACISLAYRWRINPEGADEVFADYRNSDLEINDAVRKALVSTNVKASINEVFGTYDPLANTDISSDMTPQELANTEVNAVPDLPEFNAAVQENVEGKLGELGDLIDIQSVTISFVALPERTQARIDAFNAAVQDTKIALQSVATKEAQAEGNRVLAESLQDPNVLVSKCLDSLAAGDFEAPAGFSCWSGGGSGVVLPQASN